MRTDIESCEPVRMAYHSSFNATPSQLACGCPILSLRGRARGPAGPTADPDIVDEALHLFRPNVFFKSFEVQGPADRLLVYLSMHIAACLERLLDAKGGKEEAGRMLFMLAHETVRVPGEAGFGLSGLMAPPTEKAEQGRRDTGWRRSPQLDKSGANEPDACNALNEM
ncbi:unnamed protein product [Ostreobium quekettii]|uniref:Actin-related protein 2/3 complex subunit 3 n=1 Tax=Ostreobium quekettii TaxID=121088 RepID=A0A8S1IUH6_9CHLO|nr:unnamed protein product [Ostreobium quekettii]